MFSSLINYLSFSIIIALVIAFAYQIWSKGKSKPKDKKKGASLKDEAELEELFKKRPAKPKGGEQSIDDMKRMTNFKDQLDTIDRKTKQLNEMVGIQKDMDLPGR